MPDTRECQLVATRIAKCRHDMCHGSPNIRVEHVLRHLPLQCKVFQNRVFIVGRAHPVVLCAKEQLESRELGLNVIAVVPCLWVSPVLAVVDCPTEIGPSTYVRIPYARTYVRTYVCTYVRTYVMHVHT